MRNQIPKGMYCYEIQSIHSSGRINTKICPYWQRVGKFNGKCHYLNIEDESSQMITHLWDQLKECNINMDNN